MKWNKEFSDSTNKPQLQQFLALVKESNVRATQVLDIRKSIGSKMYVRTPRKLTRAMKINGWKMYFPIEIVPFFEDMLIFGGVSLSLNVNLF